MHGLEPARRAFGQTDRTRVKMVRGKQAWARLCKTNDGLLYHALQEPVCEVGTLRADPQGVFLKRGRRVHRLQGVRFDAVYHSQRATATVLLTRQGHDRNVLLVLRSDPPEFNAVNRVPDSRFVVLHARSSLPRVLLAPGQIPDGPGLVLCPEDPGTALLLCPAPRVGTYDKRRFVVVDKNGKTLVEIGGRRYHMRHGAKYYMDTHDRVMCPVF